MSYNGRLMELEFKTAISISAYNNKNSLLKFWQMSDFPFLSSSESILSVDSFQNVATFIFVVDCLTTFPLDV